MNKDSIRKIIFKTLRILQIEEYKYPYIYEKLKSKFNIFLDNQNPKLYDIVFVIHDAKGWILEGICKEIVKYYSGKWYFAYSLDNLPPAKAYFFAHYAFFSIALKRNPILWRSKNFVWYTHPKDIGREHEELIYTFNQATKIISTCSEYVKLLQTQGVKPEKITYVLGGADPEIFQYHERCHGVVGFCSSYYPRKSPDLMFNIIKSMPHRKFILLGRDWEKYENFAELIALQNLVYVEAPYSDYPQYYAQMDVFVSTSKLEGGPIPLIEAMMCNIVPVASRTGFAPDVIVHGSNGFIFDIDSDCETVCQLIEEAFNLKNNIRDTVYHLSWENFSLNIQSLLNNH
ncbi:glycosyltransferase family 4 protein [Calothrix sp. 336/3]|uniref:glycosyltransferase family 4 protein n=1 Tax=Calothrix sp. 336/3 TaxID=1337936 RepID=UPI0011873F2F|nr:glycosyltransferase family 4 protein [Calothrix sp. 336/3]